MRTRNIVSNISTLIRNNILKLAFCCGDGDAGMDDDDNGNGDDKNDEDDDAKHDFD
jgi:hypothetical protein